MANIKINSGGGGVAFGAGAIATGVGGNVYTQAPASDVVSMPDAMFAEFVGALSELKMAMLRAGVGAESGLPARIAQAEQEIIASNGRVDADGVRKLLAAARFAGRSDAQLAEAVARAAAPIQARPAPDVFISYKREERAYVAPVAEALSRLAVDVWFDALLQPGQSFTGEICEGIDGCAVQLVCWSSAAISSDWVRGEADLGRLRNVLVPVLIEECRLTPPFNMLHSESLVGWRGEARHAGWRKVLGVLEGRLGRPGLTELAALLEDNDAAAIARWRQTNPRDPFSLGTHV